MIDVAAVALLAGCGLAGFRLVFSGDNWLVVGGVGIAAGAAIAWVGAARRLGALVVAGLTLAAYVALSGISAPNDTTIRGVPSLDSIRTALHVAVTGWKSIITTRPPVGASAGLLAIPLLCTLLTVTLAASAALRTRGVARPVLPLLVLLGGSILLGVDRPAALAIQAGVFAGVAIGWVAWRNRSHAGSVGAASGRVRTLVGVGMVALGVVAGSGFGGKLPGASANPRFILRDRSDPPFDPRTYPSPLARYRHYSTKAVKGNVVGKQLFTIVDRDGALVDSANRSDRSVKEPIQMAVLDRYDGVVWNVAGAPTGNAEASGLFRSVGEAQPPPAARGRAARFTVEIGPAYDEVWLPTIGHVTNLHFSGPRRRPLTDSWRFNRTTGTGVVQQLLQAGDRIDLESVLADQGADAQGGDVPIGSIDLPRVEQMPFELRKLAKLLTKNVSQTGVAATLVKQFTQDPPAGDAAFGFSNGDEQQNASGPGHNVQRMNRFAQDYFDLKSTSGNGEQYASAHALMARSLGVPTRVVMGFCLTTCREDTHGRIVVQGKDVAAWTEVYLDGVGWTRFKPTPDQNKHAQQPQPQPVSPKPQNADQPPPPPPVTRPLADPPTSKSRTHKKQPSDGSALGIPVAAIAKAGLVLSPLWITGLLAVGIVLAKRRRRERRRTGGSGRDRISAGWAEMSDLAQDLGRPAPRQATRREAATLLGTDEVQRVAHLADAAVFGSSQPTEASVNGYWSEVDSARAALLAPLSRVQRMRTSINPSSLRTQRPPARRPASRAPIKKDSTA